MADSPGEYEQWELEELEYLVSVLSAQTDPVLAELWDNEMDVAYDRL